ncbi:MAG: hypothetical protein ABI690_28330 [Chloroflexota bacterium]
MTAPTTNDSSRLKRLRDKWPLLFLVVLVIYVRYTQYNLCLPTYVPQTDAVIDYDALLREYDFQHSHAVTNTLFVVLNGIAIALIFRAKRKIIMLVALIVFDLYIGLILFFGAFCIETRLTPAATTAFNQRTYHLTINLSIYDDYSVRSYMVFECGAASAKCHFLNQVIVYPKDYDFPSAKFVVDPADKSLYVEVDDPKIPRKLIASPN